jgi:hypothetical protein
MRGVGFLHQDCEIHSCRPTADDVNFHSRCYARQS